MRVGIPKENLTVHCRGSGLSRAVLAATLTADEDNNENERHDTGIGTGKVTITTPATIAVATQIGELGTESETGNSLFAELYPVNDSNSGHEENHVAGTSESDAVAECFIDDDSLLKYLQEFNGDKEWDDLPIDFDNFDINDLALSPASSTNSDLADVLTSTNHFEEPINNFDCQNVLNSKVNVNTISTSSIPVNVTSEDEPNSTNDGYITNLSNPITLPFEDILSWSFEDESVTSSSIPINLPFEDVQNLSHNDDNVSTLSIPISLTFEDELNLENNDDNISTAPIANSLSLPVEQSVERIVDVVDLDDVETEVLKPIAEFSPFLAIPLVDLSYAYDNTQMNEVSAWILPATSSTPISAVEINTKPVHTPSYRQRLQEAILAKLRKLRKIKPKGKSYHANNYRLRLTRRMIMSAKRELRGKIITIKWRSKKGVKIDREESDEISDVENWGDYTPKKICTFCGKHYSFYYYSKHLRNAHYDGIDREGSNWLGCPICHLMCKNRKARTIHMMEVHSEEELKYRFKCDNCPSVFKNLEGIRAHMESEHPIHILSCPVEDRCHKKFPSARTLFTHLRVEHKLNFTCKICKAPFHTRMEVKDHYKSHNRRANPFIQVERSRKSKTKSWGSGSTSNAKSKPNPKSCRLKLPRNETPMMSLDSYINQFLLDF